MLDSMSLSDLEEYLGKDSTPEDFNLFWKEQLMELEEMELKYTFKVKETRVNFAECFELIFESRDQSKIYSKVIFPKKEKFPVLFKFHGYQGQSDDWSTSLGLVAAGVGVVMMDVRGQAGKSTDMSIHEGNTVKGHVIRGVTADKADMFYKKVYEDVFLLMKIIGEHPKVDDQKMMSYGASQGGALALISAALNPKLVKIFSIYPFLSDFRRVLELNNTTEAYDELHRYFKFTDPLYETKDNVFNNLGYIDVKNFSSMINAETTMICGLKDEVCPPSTQFAIYNRIESKKEMIVMPEYGHEDMKIRINDIIYNWATGSIF